MVKHLSPSGFYGQWFVRGGQRTGIFRFGWDSFGWKLSCLPEILVNIDTAKHVWSEPGVLLNNWAWLHGIPAVTKAHGAFFFAVLLLFLLLW